MSKYSEEELIEGLKCDNTAIIKLVYDNNIRRAYKVVLNNSGTEEEALTVFHESLIVLIENIRNKKYKGDAVLSTYLTSIIKFKWLSVLKKKKLNDIRLNKAYESIDFYEPEEDREAKYLELEKHLGSLKEECKKLLIAYYYKKEKLRKIANDLEYTESFVRVKKIRCLKALKSIIENSNYELS